MGAIAEIGAIAFRICFLRSGWIGCIAGGVLAIRSALGIGAGTVAGIRTRSVAVIRTGTIGRRIVCVSTIAVIAASTVTVIVIVSVSRVAALGIVHKITS